MEDIAWFCAKCWRFGANAKEAGGISTRERFYAGYREASGREIDPVAVGFWEVMAHLRWAVIALRQADRYFDGAEPALELAAIGRRPAEMELEILILTGVISDRR
jgi:aminoglycoside phosphotransferase (APT) family kinase protein